MKVSELVPGTIYREILSGMKVRVNYTYANDTRASVTYYSAALGKFIRLDVRDGELEELVDLEALNNEKWCEMLSKIST